MKEPQPLSQQRYVLEGWVRECGWSSGCEIGVLRGANIFHLLDTFPNLSMTGVDQWLRLEDTGVPGFETYSDHDMQTYRRHVMTKAIECGAGRCAILPMSSLDAARLTPDEIFDFIFIDACHTEAAVRADILAWAPKVKDDGWIAGHDWIFPLVNKVLHEELPGWEKHSDQCWRIEKRRSALA